MIKAVQRWPRKGDQPSEPKPEGFATGAFRRMAPPMNSMSPSIEPVDPWPRAHEIGQHAAIQHDDIKQEEPAEEPTGFRMR